MSLEQFKIVENNPNDASGGGGCLCSNAKVSDCTGPYAVFLGMDTDDIQSPACVIGANCLRKAAAALDGEVLAGGEKGFFDIDQEEPVTDEVDVVAPPAPDDPPPVPVL